MDRRDFLRVACAALPLAPAGAMAQGRLGALPRAVHHVPGTVVPWEQKAAQADGLAGYLMPNRSIR
jgi:hypothetical protein